MCSTCRTCYPFIPVALRLRPQLISALLLGSLLALPVLAQTDEPLPADTTRERGTVELPQMMVTGEKTSRSLHETSSSTEVYDFLRIESTPGATNVNSLLQITPNVVDVGTGNDLPAVRGVDGTGPTRGAGAFLSGTRPRLNLSLDGRSLTHREFTFGPQSLWDVEQVEIFRGPQSHIQGRNAIAGAIVVTSKDPVFAWEGAARVGVAEQGYFQTAAMVSGPLVQDELAFRLSVDRQERESFVKMESYDPVGNPREFETTTVRAKLLYAPLEMPTFSTMLSIAHFDSRAPQNEALIPPPEHQGARFDPRRPVQENESTSGIWDLSWELSDQLSFENKLVFTDFANYRRVAEGLPSADSEGTELQIEPLLRFNHAGDRLRGLAGARYFRGSQDEFVNLFGGSTFDDKTTTTSVFAEVVYALHPQVDITLASRFEREERQRDGGAGTTVEVDLDETYSAFLPKVDVAWKPIEGQTFGAMVARGFNPGGAGMTFVAPPYISYTFDSEYVWNYELYSRHRLSGGRLELTSNIFYNDYKDMQLPYYLGPNSTVIYNADKAQSYGAELGMRWLATPELVVFGSVGLLETEIKRFPDSGIEGNELPRAPSHTLSLGTEYAFTQRLSFSANAAFSDGYYSYYDNDERGAISSHWSANIQATYLFRGGRVTLYVENLFDADDNLLITDNDIHVPIVQQPRIIGAALELRF
ncbi:TonB-dependent receptor [Desulfurispirillum indicum]|uniref:TonB-dependent receptor n=1 Tax=Desulfurispirillum indicum TaxID=936456 RepID=UPI001CFBC901|nr:TonB-dependent receptor [Desulfurispirillum indicum]UCZ57324.1 TonB-dependent receptor [Desulfurispirillum indicum]